MEERPRASLGLGDIQPVLFESCRGISSGGVMLLLPFLLECGLLSYREHYRPRDGGYYNFDCPFIVMAFLYLCRVKSLEQTKHLNPGDWGKMIGYDRIPEVKKLRGLVSEITGQGRCAAWSADLARQWIGQETPGLYYVDGHAQVYHGALAELGKKHVSRQRLCLPGMMEYWVNSAAGMPFFLVTAEVNERMIEMLETEIVPRLLELHPVSGPTREMMESDPGHPLFTLVFDREAYSPAFFKRLWEEHRVAVITYKIPVSGMPLESRYTKLDQESKHLQNIVKMICYRAETALARLFEPHFSRSRDEIRALVKSIIKGRIDLRPDHENGKLEITLYPLANNRSNEAVRKIIHLLNQTRTKYPGTDLTLCYKTATI